MVIYANPPVRCDLCKAQITNEFSDARLSLYGTWGNVCPSCANEHNVSYGTGYGQRYKKNEAGNFIKVEG